eukprot:1151002-Pelagomonas_calceolata.AAC.2
MIAGCVQGQEAQLESVESGRDLRLEEWEAKLEEVERKAARGRSEWCLLSEGSRILHFKQPSRVSLHSQLSSLGKTDLKLGGGTKACVLLDSDDSSLLEKDSEELGGATEACPRQAPIPLVLLVRTM